MSSVLGSSHVVYFISSIVFVIMQVAVCKGYLKGTNAEYTSANILHIDNGDTQHAHISSFCNDNLSISMKGSAGENNWHPMEINSANVPITTSTIIRFECASMQYLNVSIDFDGQIYEMNGDHLSNQPSSPWTTTDQFVEFDFSMITENHSPIPLGRRRLSATHCVGSPYIEMDTSSYSSWQRIINGTNSSQSDAFTINNDTTNCQGHQPCIRLTGPGTGLTKERVYIEQKLDSSAWYGVNFGLNVTVEKLDDINEYVFFETVCDGIVQTDTFYKDQKDKVFGYQCLHRVTPCNELIVRIGGLLSGNSDYLWIPFVVYSRNLTTAPTSLPSSDPTFYPTNVPTTYPTPNPTPSCVGSPYIKMDTSSYSSWQRIINGTNSSQSNAFTINNDTINCQGRQRCIRLTGPGTGLTKERVYIEQKLDSSAWFDVNFGLNVTVEKLDDEYAFFETVCDGTIQTDIFYENQKEKIFGYQCLHRITPCNELFVRIGGLISGNSDYLWIPFVVYRRNLTDAPTTLPTESPSSNPTQNPTHSPTGQTKEGTVLGETTKQADLLPQNDNKDEKQTFLFEDILFLAICVGSSVCCTIICVVLIVFVLKRKKMMRKQSEIQKYITSSPMTPSAEPVSPSSVNNGGPPVLQTPMGHDDDLNLNGEGKNNAEIALAVVSMANNAHQTDCEDQDADEIVPELNMMESMYDEIETIQ